MNTTIPDKDKRFIADFYKYSFVGIMLDWIKQGHERGLRGNCQNDRDHTARRHCEFHQELYKAEE